MRYRLVIFDFDGTLADSAGWMRASINDVARRYRFKSVPDHEVDALRDLDTREVLRRLEVSWWKLPFIARHVRRRMARDAHRIAVFEGVPELLAELSERGIEIAVVTSNAEANVRTILGPETSRHIRTFQCGAGLFSKRPKLRRALRRAGVRAHEALAIGDEVRDLDAAHAEGIPTGAVSWGYATPGRLRAQRPTVMFESVEDMRRLLLAER